MVLEAQTQAEGRSTIPEQQHDACPSVVHHVTDDAPVSG
jgi:hypothetical protein